MKLDIRLLHGSEIPSWARLLDYKVNLVMKHLETIMATMAELKAAVERNTAIGDSIVVLLNGIVQQLKDALANSDPNAIAEVVAAIEADTQKLTEAVTANTPAPPPEPV